MSLRQDLELQRGRSAERQRMDTSIETTTRLDRRTLSAEDCTITVFKQNRILGRHSRDNINDIRASFQRVRDIGEGQLKESVLVAIQELCGRDNVFCVATK
jgi:hypothetical protein